MDKELQRAKSELGKLTPAAYFISYTVYDEQEAMAVGINGSLVTSTSEPQADGGCHHAGRHAGAGQCARRESALGDQYRYPAAR